MAFLVLVYKSRSKWLSIAHTEAKRSERSNLSQVLRMLFLFCCVLEMAYPCNTILANAKRNAVSERISSSSEKLWKIFPVFSSHAPICPIYHSTVSNISSCSYTATTRTELWGRSSKSYKCTCLDCKNSNHITHHDAHEELMTVECSRQCL